MIEVGKVIGIAFLALFGVVAFTVLWEILVDLLFMGIGRLVCWLKSIRT